MQLPQAVRDILPPRLDKTLKQRVTDEFAETLEEIRLTSGQPLLLIGNYGERICDDIQITPADLEQVMIRLTKGSLYAFERELAQGFLTLSGGHRAGFCGTALESEGGIRSQKEISSVNIRLARGIPGCGDALLNILCPFFSWGEESLLILSPPGAGKTTLLRDLILALSEARPPLKRGYRVGIVDERSELAALQNGMAQYPLGPRAFVLNAAPKAEGLRLLLRSMTPQILATDELGSDDEWQALLELARSGVGTIFTAHARTLNDMQRHDGFASAVREAKLHTIVILKRDPKPGSIEKIWHWGEGEWSELVVQDNRRYLDSGGGFLGRRNDAQPVVTAHQDHGRITQLRGISGNRTDL